MARLSAETPLRALTNGISANGGNLWLRWQQNESRELRASVAPSHSRTATTGWNTARKGGNGCSPAPAIGWT